MSVGCRGWTMESNLLIGRWEGGSRGRGHMCTYGWLMYGRNQTNIVKAIILQLKINLKIKKRIARRWQRDTAWSLRVWGLRPGTRRKLVRLLETVAVFLNSQRGRHAAPPLQRFQGSQKVALGTLFSALFLVGSPAALRAANRVCPQESPPPCRPVRRLSQAALWKESTSLPPVHTVSRLLTKLLLLL